MYASKPKTCLASAKESQANANHATTLERENIAGGSLNTTALNYNHTHQMYIT
jgi:hypothetical protein